MGFDITYHPIKESEIKEWYFDAMKDEKKAKELAENFGIGDFYTEKYIKTLKAGKSTNDNEIFDKTHGSYIAMVQGFFREHFYVRGAAFSFLLDKESEYEKYTKKWEDILSGIDIKNKMFSLLTENYSSGVYVPFESVKQLLEDYKNDKKVKNDLDEFFSHKRINVFLKALNYAKDNECGLLEASEIVEPDVMDLSKTGSYSNLDNCDPEGAFLYQEAGLEQLSQVLKKDDKKK